MIGSISNLFESGANTADLVVGSVGDLIQIGFGSIQDLLAGA